MKGDDKLTHCYICNISDTKVPNSKVIYKGKRNGKRVQRTIRICNCCGGQISDDDIYEIVKEDYGWDDEL